MTGLTHLEIHEEQKFHEHVQQVNTLRVQVKEAKTYYDQSRNLLKQVEEKLAKNLDPVLVTY